MSAVHVIGDVHGEREKLRDLLRGAGFTSGDDRWTGADSRLWLMGDLVDHGPDGAGVIALVMRLQDEARRAGGSIDVLIGNHDILLLAAWRFGEWLTPDGQQTFRELWEENDGAPHDLACMSEEQARWLSALPAMARAGDHLLVHGDALLYAGYGASLPEVNRAFAGLLAGDDTAAWYQLLDDFNEHGSFAKARDGVARAEAFLDRFGGSQIVHGHTPIGKLTGQPAEAVREPLLYADERCLDVDPGLYLGGSGFITHLPTNA